MNTETGNPISYFFKTLNTLLVPISFMGLPACSCIVALSIDFGFLLINDHSALGFVESVDAVCLVPLLLVNRLSFHSMDSVHLLYKTSPERCLVHAL